MKPALAAVRPEWQGGARQHAPLTAVMTRAVVSVRPEDTVEKGLRLLVDHAVSGLPVVDDAGRPVGMLSRGDLLEERLEVLTEGERAGPTRVRDLMTGNSLSLPQTATVAQVAGLMASSAVHRLPVVDADGCLVGIVSTLDLLRWLSLGFDVR